MSREVIIISSVLLLLFSTCLGLNSTLLSDERDVWLVRILGNDLPPLQSLGQTYNNVKYILENEGDLPRSKKLYLLNRILDDDQHSKLLHLLRSHNVPEDMIIQRHIDWHNLPKGDKAVLNYMTSINEARNLALDKAFVSGAQWVVLNDGNVFVPIPTWSEILTATKDEKVLYIATPHVRLSAEQDPHWLTPHSTREMLESKIAHEPQEGAFSFKHDAPARFKENLAYGDADKWALLEELCGTPKPDIKPQHPEKFPKCKPIHNAVIRMWPYPEQGAENAITDSGKRWHLRKVAVDNFEKKIKRYMKWKTKASVKSEKKVNSLSIVPVISSSSSSAPVVNTPVVSAPAVNAPVVSAPVVSAPVVASVPVVNDPAINAPAINAPVVNAPAVNAPAVNAPAVNAPAVNAPAVNAPAVASAPAINAPVVASTSTDDQKQQTKTNPQTERDTSLLPSVVNNP